MPVIELHAKLRLQRGFTMVEAVVTMIVMALLLGAFTTVATTVFEARQHARERERLTRAAAFAMQRMVTAVRETPGLVLPLADNPATAQDEALREQRVPPEAGNEDRSAVLAVRLSADVDRNADGIADADNDGDGRIDEDPGDDANNDGEHGIALIDDDHDGLVDEGSKLQTSDDDEDGTEDEDRADGADDDLDQTVDEDPAADRNGDGAPGLAGVDDDGDGDTDEGQSKDDDEDGLADEDWYDLAVFYLDGNALVERQAYPFDFTGDSKITGRDYIETVIAENVGHFRVERIARPRGTIVDITLELTGANDQRFNLTTRVRAGEGS